MKIPFSISNDDSENPIVYTLSHSKKFIYKKLKDLINQQGKKFIIIVDDIEKKRARTSEGPITGLWGERS